MSLTADSIISLIQSRGRGNPPSALSDIFVVPLSQTGIFLDTKINFARTEQTVDDIVATLENDSTIALFALQLQDTADNVAARLRTALEGIASNFNIQRRPAMISRGTAFFMRASQSDRDIAIPVGTRMLAPATNQEYRVSTTVLATAGSFTQDATVNKYVVSVPIESVNTGAATAVGVQQITVLKSNVQYIDQGVTNPTAVVGGRDAESDRALATRIKTALSANNIGTKAGYDNLIMQSLTEVKDVLVVGAGDPYMFRDQGDGGSVDIYVTDPIPYTNSEPLTSSNTVTISPTIYQFTPSRQPIIDDITMINVPVTLLSPLTITKDVSQLGGSIDGKDIVTIITSDPLLGNTIEYGVNNIVQQTQAFLDDPTRKILGSDVLVKEAIPVLVNVTMTVKLLSGFSNSRTPIQNSIINGITQFVSELGIGVPLEESDLVKIVVDIAGVDRVNLPLDILDIAPGTGSNNVITPEPNEVIRVNTVTVTFL